MVVKDNLTVLTHPTTGGKGGSLVGVFVQAPDGSYGMTYFNPDDDVVVVESTSGAA